MHIEAFPHSISCSLAQTIGFSVMYFRVFIEIFEFQMYIRGIPLTVVGGYWMLWISKEGFSSRMNVCNISSFVTLTLCVVVGF